MLKQLTKTIGFVFLISSNCLANSELNKKRIKILKKIKADDATYLSKTVESKIIDDIQEIRDMSVYNRFNKYSKKFYNLHDSKPALESDTKRLFKNYTKMLVDLNSSFIPLTPREDKEIAEYIALCIMQNFINETNREVILDIFLDLDIHLSSIALIKQELINLEESNKYEDSQLESLDYFINNFLTTNDMQQKIHSFMKSSVEKGFNENDNNEIYEDIAEYENDIVEDNNGFLPLCTKYEEEIANYLLDCILLNGLNKININQICNYIANFELDKSSILSIKEQLESSGFSIISSEKQKIILLDLIMFLDKLYKETEKMEHAIILELQNLQL